MWGETKLRGVRLVRRAPHMRTFAVVITLVIAVALAATGSARAQLPIDTRKVRAVRGIDTIECTDGTLGRLVGLALPSVAVRDPSMVVALRAHLKERLEGQTVVVEASTAGFVVRLVRSGPSIAVSALSGGLGVLGSGLDVDAIVVADEAAALVAAANLAQSRRAGWFAPPPPVVTDAFQAGAVVALPRDGSAANVFRSVRRDRLRSAVVFADGVDVRTLRDAARTAANAGIELLVVASAAASDAALVDLVDAAEAGGVARLAFPPGADAAATARRLRLAQARYRGRVGLVGDVVDASVGGAAFTVVLVGTPTAIASAEAARSALPRFVVETASRDRRVPVADWATSIGDARGLYVRFAATAYPALAGSDAPPDPRLRALADLKLGEGGR